MAIQRSRRAPILKPKKRQRSRNKQSEPESESDPELGLGFQILELPDHLILDVLARLPVKYVLRCRCVCKSFYRFLRDQYFLKLYLSRQPSSSCFITRRFLNYSVHLNFLNLDDPSSWSFPLSSSSSSSCDGRASSGQNPNFNLPYGMELVNSCNGLLCLYHNSTIKPRYYVCNPILGEFLALPSPPPAKSDQRYLGYSVFGFNPETNRYKVVRLLVSSDEMTVVAQVHTLGMRSWRCVGVGVGGAPVVPKLKPLDPFVNGAVHWIRHEKSVTSSGRGFSELICSFDLGSEEFRSVPPPLHFNAGYVKAISWINVGVLGGCLCLCYVHEGTTFRTWVMKEYGERGSWTEKFAIDMNSYVKLEVGDKHMPIGFLNNGDMWLKCDSCSLLYSPSKGSFKDLSIYGIGPKVEAVHHIPSFASLKDIVVSRKNKNLKVQVVESGKTLVLLY